MHRRQFLKASAVSTAALAVATPASAAQPTKAASGKSAPSTYDAWLRARHERVISTDRLDGFFGPQPNNQWAKFDPELGYMPHDSIQRDGIGGSHNIHAGTATLVPSGSRTQNPSGHHRRQISGSSWPWCGCHA